LRRNRLLKHVIRGKIDGRIIVSGRGGRRHKQLLDYVKDWNILHTVRRRKPNWIGHILRRSRLLKHVIGGKIERRIEVTRRGGRIHKQLLDDLKETRG
jgi:hypothetical protein